MIEEKITKDRSALYPVVTINECLDIIDAINRIGGKLVSVESVAKEVNMSIKTNSFRSKISTSKQFGLIKSTGGALQLTDLAKQYLYPVDDSSKSEILVNCFLSAPLYQKLTSRYENQAVPNKDRLSNILYQEYNITKSAKDIAAEQFLKSAEQVGILKNGVIILESEEPILTNEKLNSDTHNELASIEAGTVTAKIPVKTSTLQNAENEFITQSLPMQSGKVAKLIIPNDADEESLLLLKDMFDAILRRRFKIDT